MFTLYKWFVFTISFIVVGVWFVLLFGSVFGGIYAVFFNRKLLSHPLTLLHGFKESSGWSKHTDLPASQSDPH